jgi:predicted RNA-binding Zn-ribbon protein involved in translation (DUF1610 family)
MGRKKRKKGPQPFCYYCNRTFEGEKILIQHQKAKHFKCPNCHKKMVTAHALRNHMFQVHKESLKIVPNSKEGRDSVELHIHGMQGVPPEAVAQKEKEVDSAAKRPRIDGGDDSGSGEEEESGGESDTKEDDAKQAPPPPPPATTSSTLPSSSPAIPSPQSQPSAFQFPGMQAGFPVRPGMPQMPMMPGMMPMMQPGLGRGFPLPGMARGAPLMQNSVPPNSMSASMSMPSSPPSVATSLPSAPSNSSAKLAEEDDRKGQGKTVFVFKNELSMEELRAQLPKHRFDPSQSQATKLSSLSESIQQRMADLKRLKG